MECRASTPRIPSAGRKQHYLKASVSFDCPRGRLFSVLLLDLCFPSLCLCFFLRCCLCTTQKGDAIILHPKWQSYSQAPFSWDSSSHVEVMALNQTGPVMGDNDEAVLCGLCSFCMPRHFIGALVFRTVVSCIGKCTSSWVSSCSISPLLNFCCDLNISSGGFVYCQMLWISPNTECKIRTSLWCHSQIFVKLKLIAFIKFYCLFCRTLFDDNRKCFGLLCAGLQGFECVSVEAEEWVYSRNETCLVGLFFYC